MNTGMTEQEKTNLDQEAVEDADTAKEQETAKDSQVVDGEAVSEEKTKEPEEAIEPEEGEENTEEDTGEVTGEEPKGWAGRRAAKKKEKQDKKEEAYKEQISQLEDKVKRQLAEFENFRNRTEKEKAAMFETGAKSVIEKMLPIVDNFERGLATIDPEDENDAFTEGMKMVYRQLLTEFENLGVKPIEAVGKEFDPNLHNAVMQVESEEYESGVVAQELQKGYTYRDTVVRYAMVSVTV